jgi:hypothetical protein
MKKRSNVPPKIADAVLVANNHTCCICTEPRKHVVFHHIDSDPSNHDPANLAVVCHDCHSRVTGDEGLGRQYSPREVTQYKQRWEQRCAQLAKATEEEDPVEPAHTVYEITRIRAGEHGIYDFEMSTEDDLVVSVSADHYIDISICTSADYKRWLKTNDLREYAGASDVRECELSFTAPRDGIYYLLLINKNKKEVEVEVDAAMWDGEV